MCNKSLPFEPRRIFLISAIYLPWHWLGISNVRNIGIVDGNAVAKINHTIDGTQRIHFKTWWDIHIFLFVRYVQLHTYVL